MTTERLIKIGEAARYLGVHPETLKRWETKGRIRSFKSPGGQHRYTLEDLKRVRLERQLPDNAFDGPSGGDQ